MPKIRKSKADPRRTNWDSTGGRRPYRLSPTGLASLRRSAAQTKPWARSTGPRTPAGKARAKMNALKHGERGARARAARSELADLLARLKDLDRQQAADESGVGFVGSATATWADRIALELSAVERVIGDQNG